MERLLSLLSGGSSAPPFIAGTIAADHVAGSDVGRVLEPGRDYFRIELCELMLAERSGRSRDGIPLLICETQFVYDYSTVSLPVVIGLSDLDDRRVPKLRRFVAGPHPLRSGALTFKLTLLRLPDSRSNAALVRILLNTTAPFDFARDLNSYLRATERLQDSIAELTNGSDAEVLLAFKTSFAQDHGQPLASHFGCAIRGPANSLDLNRLRVNDYSLYYETRPSGLERLVSADYVLYRVSGESTRDDWDSLPFAGQFDSVMRDAARGDNESWNRAQAGMRSIAADVLSSPDVTHDDARRIVEAMRQELGKLHNALGP
jgi:hypothetical protein